MNELVGKRVKLKPSFLEADGKFLTKPVDITNYLSSYFSNKIQKLHDGIYLRHEDDGLSSRLMEN